MEPIRDKVAYTIYTSVDKVFQHKHRIYRGGLGKDAVYEEVPAGWYIHLAGSREALFLGMMQPELEQFDQVKITIERIDNAKFT